MRHRPHFRYGVCSGTVSCARAPHDVGNASRDGQKTTKRCDAYINKRLLYDFITLLVDWFRMDTPTDTPAPYWYKTKMFATWL